MSGSGRQGVKKTSRRSNRAVAGFFAREATVFMEEGKSNGKKNTKKQRRSLMCQSCAVAGGHVIRQNRIQTRLCVQVSGKAKAPNRGKGTRRRGGGEDARTPALMWV